MFLEQMIDQMILDKESNNVLNLVISQLNLLLSLVSDVLDMKLINEGMFNSQMESFNPKSTLDFIVAMFKPQSQA